MFEDYILEADQLAPLHDHITNDLHLIHESSPISIHHYLDSFDHLIEKNGEVLESIALKEGKKLIFWELASGRVLNQSLVKKIPAFVHEIEDEEFRRLLEMRLGPRAILFQGHVQSKRDIYRWENNEKKTVAKLVIEENIFPESSRNKNSLHEHRVRILRLRGYEKYAVQLKESLINFDGLVQAQQNIVTTARQHDRGQHRIYDAKPVTALNRQENALTGCKAIFLDLHEVLKANVTGMLHRTDIEFLHDFRIAVRRTRSLLNLLKGVVDKPTLNYFRAEFKWLQSITSDPRDMDVYLQHLPNYIKQLPADYQEELQPLETLLEERCAASYRKLKKSLTQKRYQQFVKKWEDFCQSEKLTKGLKYSKASVQEVAYRMILQGHDEVLKQGDAITATSPADDLHDLRKTCKKLRYTLDAFQSLFERHETALMTKTLKKLQENLGQFQDFEVQAQTLESLVMDLNDLQETNDEITPYTFVAIGMLVQQLLEKQDAARGEFDNVYKTFRHSPAEKIYLKMSHSKSTSKEVSNENHRSLQ